MKFTIPHHFERHSKVACRENVYVNLSVNLSVVNTGIQVDMSHHREWTAPVAHMIVVDQLAHLMWEIVGECIV